MDSVEIAKQMIDLAKSAGVDAVKFQTFKAKEHYSHRTPKIGLYKENIYDLIEKLEIDRKKRLPKKIKFNVININFNMFGKLLGNKILLEHTFQLTKNECLNG